MRKSLTTRVDTGGGSSFMGLKGLDDLEWQLRYADATEVRFVAASIVASYKALIQLPQKRRNEVCALIQKAHAKEIKDADTSTNCT